MYSLLFDSVKHKDGGFVIKVKNEVDIVKSLFHTNLETDK